MKTSHYFTKSRILRVTGNLWSGSRCAHEYALKDGENPTTIREAKRFAGDFESLEHAQIVITEAEITERTKTVRLEHAEQTVQK
jgi:hypothetical protein